MKVLLLAGCQPNLESLLQSHYGEPLIDFQINKLLSYGYEVTVVLSGDGADEVLRNSKSVKYCELVFDANESEANFKTNLRSGLYATRQSCFAINALHFIPKRKVFEQLRRYLYREGFNTETHIFRPYRPIQGQMTEGFPLLISKAGNNLIKNDLEIKNIKDSKIEITPVPCVEADITLQHASNHLQVVSQLA